MSGKPLNIAHRGGAGLRPENTLAAFAHALDLGVDGFELDVHVAKDGTVVVFHDDALKPEIVRDANGHWIEAPGPLIKDLTFARIAELRHRAAEAGHEIRRALSRCRCRRTASAFRGLPM